MSSNKRFSRYWEIDTLRGTALIMIIIYHLLFDLNYFGNYNFELKNGLWWFIGRSGAVIFIFLVGVSLTLSFNRFKRKNLTFPPFIKYLIRGSKIFSWGLLITLITWLLIGEGFIIFGILHFIGLSIILAYPFLKYKNINLIIGVLFILMGSSLSNHYFNFSWLLWVGFKPYGFYTLDYFPLLPWFGLVLFGLFFGHTFYPNFVRRIDIPDLSKNKIIEGFCWLGRNSLLLYLLHQPIIIFVLYLLGIIDLHLF